MFVHLQTRSCESCGVNILSNGSDIVDIPLESIRLDWSPVACSCGYFYSERHYAVSFSKWKVSKTIVESFLKDSETLLREAEELKSVLTEERYFSKINYANNLKKCSLDKLEELGSNPVPDHLFKD